MLIVKKETRAGKTNIKGDEALHLVLYQGSQWRDDDGNPLGDESRQLVAQTLAASCNKMHPLDQLALTHFTQASAIVHRHPPQSRTLTNVTVADSGDC